jgi:hypothetical protein
MIAIVLSILLLLVGIGMVYMYKREGFRRRPGIRRDSLYSYSYKPSRKMDKNDWRWFLYPPVAYIPYDEYSYNPYGTYNPYGWYPYGWSPYIGRPCRPLGPWTNELDLSCY